MALSISFDTSTRLSSNTDKRNGECELIMRDTGKQTNRKKNDGTEMKDKSRSQRKKKKVKRENKQEYND